MLLKIHVLKFDTYCSLINPKVRLCQTKVRYLDSMQVQHVLKFDKITSTVELDLKQRSFTSFEYIRLFVFHLSQPVQCSSMCECNLYNPYSIVS